MSGCGVLALLSVLLPCALARCALEAADRPLSDTDPLVAHIRGPSSVGVDDAIILDGALSYGLGVPLSYSWSISTPKNDSVEAIAVKRVKKWLSTLPADQFGVKVPTKSLPVSDAPYTFTLVVMDCKERESEAATHTVLIRSGRVEIEEDNRVPFCPAPQQRQVQGQSAGGTLKPEIAIQVLANADASVVTRVPIEEPLTLFAAVTFVQPDDLPTTYTWSMMNGTSTFEFMETGAYLVVPTNWLEGDTDYVFRVMARVDGDVRSATRQVVTNERGVWTAQQASEEAIEPHFRLDTNFVNETAIDGEPLAFFANLLEVSAAQLKAAQYEWQLHTVTDVGYMSNVLRLDAYGATSPVLSIAPGKLAVGSYWLSVRAVVSVSTAEARPDHPFAADQPLATAVVSGFVHFRVVPKPQPFGVSIESRCNDTCQTAKEAVFVAQISGTHASNTSVLWSLYRQAAEDADVPTAWERVLMPWSTNRPELVIPAHSLRPGSNYQVTVAAVAVVGSSDEHETLTASARFHFRAPWKIQAGEIDAKPSSSQLGRWTVTATGFVGDFSRRTLRYSLWYVYENNTLIPLQLDSSLPEFVVDLPPSRDGTVTLSVTAQDSLGQVVRVKKQFSIPNSLATLAVESACKELFTCELKDYAACDRAAVATYTEACSSVDSTHGNDQCVRSAVTGLIALVDTYSTWASCTSKLNPKAMELMNTRYVYRATQLLQPFTSLSLGKRHTKQLLIALDFFATHKSSFPSLPMFPHSSTPTVFTLTSLLVDVVAHSVRSQRCLHSSTAQKALDVLNEAVEFSNSVCRLAQFYGRTAPPYSQPPGAFLEVESSSATQRVAAGSAEFLPRRVKHNQETNVLSPHMDEVEDVANIGLGGVMLTPIAKQSSQASLHKPEARLPGEIAVFALMQQARKVGVDLLASVMLCPVDPPCGLFDAEEALPDPRVVDAAETDGVHRSRVELYSPSIMLLALRESTNSSGITVALSPSSLTPDINPVFQIANEAVPEWLLDHSHFLVYSVTQHQICSRECDDLASPVVHIELGAQNHTLSSETSLNPPVVLTLPLNENVVGDNSLICAVVQNSELWDMTKAQTFRQQGVQADPDTLKQACLLGSLPGDFSILRSSCHNWAPPASPSPTPTPSPVLKKVIKYFAQQASASPAPVVNVLDSDTPTPSPSVSVLGQPKKRKHAFLEYGEDESTVENLREMIANVDVEWIGVVCAGAVIGVVLAVGVFFVVLHHNHHASGPRRVEEPADDEDTSDSSVADSSDVETAKNLDD